MVGKGEEVDGGSGGAEGCEGDNGGGCGVRRMSNWKAPGPDGVRGFWFKKFSCMHQAMANSLQACLDEGNVPE